MKSSLNHIYRTIWSEALRAWVAVSELTSAKGKRSGSSLLNAVLTASAGNSANRNRKLRLKPIVFAIAYCFALNAAQANPIGAQVVNGTAAINQSGNTLNITNSPNAIINWQGFSINTGETTRFIQQTASSSVLNRVIGADPSQLLGTLTSNGRVFLINPAGILVGQGARIDVAGFVASTLNITNSDFLAGKLNFGLTPNAGTIQNNGAITTPEGGTVYLVAPQIGNQGITTTPKGETILAAGNTVQLIDTGTPGVTVQVTGANNSATNLGQILADSGRIGMVAATLKNSGTVSASSMVSQGGKVFLRATNRVEAGGTITANGTNGGRIEALGNQVGVMDGATVSANGTQGGGTVLIGGDYQGKNPNVQNAQVTYVAPTASISADATQTGDGGKIIVWSEDTTRAYGNISARGGANGGNGGFVETSGKQYLDVAGIKVSTAAPNGTTGNWLLDPTAITIVHGTATGGATFTFPFPFTSNVFNNGGGLTATLNDFDINANLATSTNVTVTTSSGALGTGDITFDASGGAITISNSPAFAALFLRLNADHDIKFIGGSTTFQSPANTSTLDLILNPVGKVTTAAGSSVTLDGNLGLTRAFVALARTWENSGTLSLTNNAALHIEHNYGAGASTFHNMSGGTVNVASTQGWAIWSNSCCQDGILINDGAIYVTASTAFEAAYSQSASGTLNIADTKFLNLQNAIALSGDVNLNASGTLNINEDHGTPASLTNLSFIGSGGSLNVVGGKTVNFSNVDAGNVALYIGTPTGGTVNVLNGYAVFNSLSMDGGTLGAINNGTFGITSGNFSIPSGVAYTGNVGYSATGALLVSHAINTTGTVSLTGVGVTNTSTITGPSGVTINAGTGTLSNAGGVITNGATSTGSISLVADSMTLAGGTIVSSTSGSGASNAGTVALSASSVGRNVNLGSTVGGTLSLLGSDLQTITAANGLVIGGEAPPGNNYISTSATGGVTVNGAISSADLSGIGSGGVWGFWLYNESGTIAVNAALTSPVRVVLNTMSGAVTVGAPLTATTGDVSMYGSSVTNSGTISGPSVYIYADTMSLANGTILAGASGATLTTLTASRPINLGSTVGGTLSLLGTDLQTITTTGSLSIGDSANTGGITVDGAITAADLAGIGGFGLASSGSIAVNAALISPVPVELFSLSGAITEPGGSIAAPGLVTNSAVGTTLNGANSVDSFNATNTASGDIALTNTVATLTVTGISNTAANGGVTVDNTGAITVDGAVYASGDLSLISSGAITETGAGTLSTAGLLTVNSTDGITLNGVNTVGGFNATNASSGNIELTNTAATLAIEDISNWANAGSITVINTGDIDFASTTGGGVFANANNPATMATLTATGQIIKSGSSVLDVQAASISLNAATGIGVGNPIFVNDNPALSLHFNNTISGDVFISSDYDMHVDDGYNGGGNITLVSTTLGCCSGGLIQLNRNTGNVTASGDITYVADHFGVIGAGSFGKTISGTGAANYVQVMPYTASQPIELDRGTGTGNPNALSLTQGTLDLFNSPKLIIGSPTAGDILITNTLDDSSSLTFAPMASGGVNNVTLITGGNVNFDTYTVGLIAPSITVEAGINVGHNASNPLTTADFDTSPYNGNISITAGGTIGSSGGGDVVLNAGSGAVSLAASGIYLQQVDAGSLAAHSSGDINLSSSAALNLSGTGNALELDATGNFVNNNAITPFNLSGAGARWLVYSTDPSFDTGIPTLTASDFMQFGAVYNDTLGQATGNGLIYSLAPAVQATVSLAGPKTKVYDGTTSIGLVASDFNVTGGSLALAVAPLVGNYDNKNVGVGTVITADISVLNDAVTGAKVYGYSLIGGSVTGTGNSITPLKVTLTAPVVSKVYDGGLTYTTVASDMTALAASLVGGDTVTAATIAYADKNVGAGNKMVSLNAATINDGNNGLNYNVTLAGNTTSTITVRPLSKWSGLGGNNLWSNPANWDALPDGNNVLSVTIPSSVTVTYDTGVGTVNLDSLSSLGNFQITGGSLGVSGSFSTAQYTQTGGNLTVGSFSASNAFSQTGGVLTANSVALNTASAIQSALGSLVANSFTANGTGGIQLAGLNNHIGSFSASNSGSGNVELTNSGVLTIAGINNSGGDILVDNTGATTTTGLVSASGAVSINAHSPLTIGSGGVAAGGNITLTAGATAGAGDNLTLNGLVKSTGSTASITLFAGDNLAQNANVSSNGGSITATALTGGISMALGTSTSGGSIDYSAAGNVILAVLNAGSGGTINLNAGGNVSAVPGSVGPSLIGGTAVINVGGNAYFKTQVKILDVTVGGSFTIIDTSGNVFSDVVNVPPIAPEVPEVVQQLVTTTNLTGTPTTSDQLSDLGIDVNLANLPGTGTNSLGTFNSLGGGNIGGAIGTFGGEDKAGSGDNGDAGHDTANSDDDAKKNAAKKEGDAKKDEGNGKDDKDEGKPNAKPEKC